MLSVTMATQETLICYFLSFLGQVKNTHCKYMVWSHSTGFPTEHGSFEVSELGKRMLALFLTGCWSVWHLVTLQRWESSRDNCQYAWSLPSRKLQENLYAISVSRIKTLLSIFSHQSLYWTIFWKLNVNKQAKSWHVFFVKANLIYCTTSTGLLATP